MPAFRMRLKAFSFVTLVLALLGVAVALPQSPSSQPPAPKLAEEQFKNIQVLKGIPADQLIPAMQFISASLGVECEHCHVQGAFDKDDKKPKQAARKMIQMMFAINKANFEGKREVTCYSCHRGAADPVGVPVITAEETRPDEAEAKAAAAQAQAALPSADQLLDKYLTAVGGASAVKKITSRVEQGTVGAFGGQRPIELYTKAPDKRISFMHVQGGDSITAYDGHSGWLSVPKRPVHFMSAEENAAARIDADFYFPITVKSMYAKFVVRPGEKIDGHDTVLVVGRNEGQPPLKLYLDVQSALLLRLDRYSDSPLGLNPTEIDFADYRDADGVKVPFRWTVARPGGRFTIQIDHIQQNIPIDDAKFAPPAPSPDQKPAGR